MGQVSIILNDRIYRLVCDDGEEDRLAELATYVKSKVAQLTAELGHAGDERLLLMAALMIADELWDARAAALPETQSAGGARQFADGAPALTEPEPVRRLKTVAARLSAGPAGADPGEPAPKPAGGPRQRGTERGTA